MPGTVSTSEDMPDWIKALRYQETDETPLAPPVPSAGGETDRLTSPGPTPGEAPAESQAESQAPSWFEQLSEAAEVEAVTEQAQPTQPVADYAPPTWIKELQSATETAETPAELPTQEPVLDWPKGEEEPAVGDVEPEPDEAVHEITLTPATGEPMPDWLQKLEVTDEAPPSLEPQAELETRAAHETEAQPEEREVTSADEFRESLEALPSETKQEQLEAGSEAEALPDWLQMAMPAPTGRDASEPAAEVPAAEAIPAAKQDEVPGWIKALKPADVLPAPLPADVSNEPAEIAGPLAGLRGVLPLAIAMAEPHIATKPAIGEERKSGAHLFEAILAAPAAEGEPSVAKKKKRIWTMRPLIYLLVALAVVVPFLLPFNLAGMALPISNTRAAEFYDVIQSLPPGSTAVVAFDYEPSLAGEMDLQAHVIVAELVRRRVRVIAVSTIETGPQIAQRTLDPAAAVVKDYRYGVDYVNMGYLAGHEAGLAQVAANGLALDTLDYVTKQALRQLPISASVKSLRDVALVVELAGTEDALQMWMEQVQPRGVRMAAGVSAAVEPRAIALRDARQLVAILGGLVGAAQFEILANQPGTAVASVDAQGAGQVVLVLVIVLGNVVYWISRARGQAT